MEDLQMRIGVDLGGTKIEVVALDRDGALLFKQRTPTPRGDYSQTISEIKGLIDAAEQATGLRGSVGLGIPGTISPKTGLVKNANSTWLNGKPFDRDLAESLQRNVRLANDANCLAVSESVDGAGAGFGLVFAVILGTGVGAGISINKRPHAGGNGVGGEWGHNPLPWMSSEELAAAHDCYCGKRGCIETYLSGPGLRRNFESVTGQRTSPEEIVKAARNGDAASQGALDLYQDRLARALGHAVNMLDPDVFVLAGGMSNIDEIYLGLQKRVEQYVFGGEFSTPIVKAQHGDSSGVRGAAWLW